MRIDPNPAVSSLQRAVFRGNSLQENAEETLNSTPAGETLNREQKEVRIPSASVNSLNPERRSRSRRMHTPIRSNASGGIRRMQDFAPFNDGTARRYFLNSSQEELSKKMSDLLEDTSSVFAQIQAPQRCEFTGGSLIKKEIPFDKLPFWKKTLWKHLPMSLKNRTPIQQTVNTIKQKMHPADFEKELEDNGPFIIRSHKLALPGSMYTEHHVFLVLGVMKLNEQKYVLRLDKDDTIFNKSNVNSLVKVLEESKSYSSAEINQFSEIIKNVNELITQKKVSDPNFELDQLSQKELINLKTLNLLLHLDSLEDFVGRIRRTESDPVAFRYGPIDPSFIKRLKDTLNPGN